jgi:hypothetical protein
MAWIFSLSAECGSEDQNVNKFAQYFDGLVLTFANHRQCKCRAEAFQDIEENWWCRVLPSNISEIGIDSPESAYSMTELGILMYQSLKFAPTFRYALVGVEVDEFRTYSELIEDLPNLAISGLVLAKSIPQELEILPSFQPFSPNYVWQPYAGETYNPLKTSPDLKNKLNELLAVA